jgi:hypothetical protein
MHAVEREILEITRYKIQRKFSGRQDYLKSIFNAVQKLKNDEFDELTDEAALWANACVESYNRDKDAELPDFNEVGDEDEDDTSENQEYGPDDESNGQDEAEDLSESDDNEGDNQGSDDEPEMDSEDEAEVDEAGVQTSGLEEEDDEPEEVVPPKKVKKVKKVKEVKQKKPTKPAHHREDDDSDVELDKWGSMVGSKNSRALAMFEKGATAGEVKDQVGGTYYNILKKMTSHGHKVEKDGAVITLIHMTEKRSKVSSPKKFKK